ncbi:Pleckstrin y domain-containing F member 2 [Cichlidogyrus casuarinus]|uniref:Pleckstrin y domain-containing F member 2 n=1 Tax=Cichlidogyrus casuarinus TaxID=1844966 RepID=A0ABD2Q3K4_9PLAT
MSVVITSFLLNFLAENEANVQRIASVEKFFGILPNKLALPGRVLVGEGVLSKMCRKGLKDRHFFLFNDILLYGNIIISRKKLSNPRVIELWCASVESLKDSGREFAMNLIIYVEFKNGFSFLSPKKSFTVYTGTSEEKTLWLTHLKHFIAKSRDSRPTLSNLEEAPVWIPDAEAQGCMICQVQFTTIKRRHHCRKCGRVICDKCSINRYFLPNQKSKKLRVCNHCYQCLTEEVKKRSHYENPINFATDAQIQSNRSSKFFSGSSADFIIDTHSSPDYYDYSASSDSEE